MHFAALAERPFEVVALGLWFDSIVLQGTQSNQRLPEIAALHALVLMVAAEAERVVSAWGVQGHRP